MSVMILDLSGDFPAIAEVEVLLGGIGRLQFPDGTYQFAENETYPEIVYSPRLTEKELEDFCREHMDKYQAFNDQHHDVIESGGDIPPINRFWEEDQS